MAEQLYTARAYTSEKGYRHVQHQGAASVTAIVDGWIKSGLRYKRRSGVLVVIPAYQIRRIEVRPERMGRKA